MLKKNLIANYLGQGWTALMGLVFIPVYIKYLGIEAGGLVGLFAVMQVWFGLLDMGLTPALGREMARFTGGAHSPQSIRDLLRSVEVVAGLVLLLIVAMGVAVSDWGARHWLQVKNMPLDVVAQTLSIMALVVGLRFLEGIYRSSIVGLQQQVLLNVVDSVLATLRWLGAVGVLVWVAPSVKAFFIWQGACSLLTIGVFAALTYSLIPTGASRARFSWTALRGLGSFAGGMFGISILVLLLTQVDKLILSRLLLLSDYGYYMLATAAAGGVFTLISPISQAYYPRLCELRERQDQKAMIEAFHTGAQLVSVIAGSVALIFLVFAEDLLRLWTQDPVVARTAGPLLSILALGNLLNGLMWIPYQTQLAHGWTSLTVWTNTVAVLFVIPAIFVVTPRYGAAGAAWVWVALNAGYLLISVQLMYRRILKTEKWHWYFQDMLLPMVPAAVVVFGLSKLLGPAHNAWAQLGSLAAVTCLTVLVAGLCAERVRARVLRFFPSLFRFKSVRGP